MNEGIISIEEMFGKDALAEMMHTIAAATGLAFVTIDYRGIPVDGVLESFSDFCQKIQSDPDRKRICEASSVIGAGQAATLQKPYIYFCPCGLLELAIPIIVKGQFLGGLVGGQVRCYDAPPDTVQLSNVLPHCRDYTKEDFREDYEKMLQLPYEKFVRYMDLAYLIVKQLSENAMATIQQKQYHKEQMELQHEYHREQMELQKEREKRIELENSFNEAQLLVLRSKTDSHFLMSTLTAIANLAAVEDAPRTNEVAAMFAKFLNDSMHLSTEAEFIFKEMESAERYLYIQKVRMGEKLEYSVCVPDEMRLQRIPSMIIFPFVERAFNYGIMHKDGNGKITVSAEYDNDDVVIQICDDGPGLKKKELEAVLPQNAEGDIYASFDSGAENAKERLVKLFGNEYAVKVTAVRGKGTTCTIRYPRSFDEEGI